ncbi:NADH-quinone oxidoreductase subunit N [Flexibacter flexilis DSM 6793]|uniref:NADH-quinone oxidoreductase subunit N n=1 Tax=Flexibacter flexilis DSM 6793 TaxID=927664 RepID=A0A1I1MCW6_9BACT|nr:NADH-quinone oxidoreductase subunit N [Flexibacter flexilis]SFC83241.1 NADH-quinone oxidoreductase subunit N [Flexibacter flexilis DSM 6793]
MNTTSVIRLFEQTIQNLPAWYAEIALAAAVPVVIILGLFRLKNLPIWLLLASLSSLFIAGMLLANSNTVSGDSLYFKAIVLISAAAALAMQWHTEQNNPDKNHYTEFCTIVIGLALGCNLLISAQDWLLFFVSVELISIASYLLVGFRFNKNSAEAGLKYLLFGAAISAMMLYGISWLYGLAWQNANLASGGYNYAILTAALGMVMGGMLFKLAGAPLHWWVADTYDAAPSSVAFFLSIAPKVAALQAVINIIGRYESLFAWTDFLSIAAIASILVGNFSALWQSNIRRLMGYSSVAHTGVLLLAVAANASGENLAFYLFIYLLASALVFIFIQNTEGEHGHLHIKQLSGFAQHDAVSPLALVLAFVSLTGLPPTAGFTAKLNLFLDVWRSYEQNNHVWLLYGLLVAVAGTAISLFFYLRVPFFMYFRAEHQTTEHNTHDTIPANLTRWILLFLAMLLVVFFVV